MADYFKQFLDDGRMPAGKYRGMPIEDICRKDRNYVEWLYNNFKNQELKDFLHKKLSQIPPSAIPKKLNVVLPHIGIIGQFVKFTGRCTFISRPISNKRGEYYHIVTVEDEFGYSVSTTVGHSSYFNKGQIYKVCGKVTKHTSYKGKNQTFIDKISFEEF